MYVQITNKALRRTIADGVEWLNVQLDGYYAANRGLSEVDLTSSMIKPADAVYPTLRAKAASRRHLVHFALFLARRQDRLRLSLSGDRLRPFSEEYRGLVIQLAEAMVAFHECCSTEPFDPDACEAAMNRYITAYHALRLLFRRNLNADLHSSQPFGARPKLHMAEHLVSEKTRMFGSPRNFWCYSDEDFMGLVKKICMQSRHPRSFERVLLAKYRLYCALHDVGLARA